MNDITGPSHFTASFARFDGAAKLIEWNPGFLAEMGRVAPKIEYGAAFADIIQHAYSHLAERGSVQAEPGSGGIERLIQERIAGAAARCSTRGNAT